MYRTLFNGKVLNRRTLPRVKRYASIRFQSSAQNAVRSLESGQQIHGYTVRKVVEVPEFSMTMVILDHNKTGAEHLHMAREDSDNAFGVSFRTTPMDSTGVPHILEHTVLCGSQKYPVRDPFFKMLNRSLSTFMNAMTSSDWTMYPFSSQNKQDYQNLMSIYLDAVFFPQLRELDFSQEGWRLELENPEDKTSSMIFKGVVFNEMKGVFSNSQRIFGEAIRNYLCPSHTYGVVYGGDPNYIPDLTWEQLKEFHATHYHPSNARFYTYGDFPMETQLQRIHEDYLQRFSQISPNTSVSKEPRWTESREVHIACALDPMAPDPRKQTTVAVNFLLCNINDVFETFTMSLIGALLVEGETSPFYRSLVESKLGSDYSPETGCQSQTLESSFSVGLQNVAPEDVAKVKSIIDDTFEKVIEEGFEEERIEAWLHQIELSMKHQTRNFGITLGISITPARNHDSDPTEHLQINKFINKFKKQIKEDPKFLQKKVKQYFKDSQHRLTLIMMPDEQFLQKKQDKEQKKLTALTSHLDDRDRDIIYQRGLDLLEKQMQTEDVSCLPTINLTDIDRKIKLQSLELLTCGNVPLQVSIQPTNEVTYLRFISNLADVPDNLLPYVPLFSMALTKMSTLSHDYKQLTQMSDLWTGGLSSEPHLATSVSNALSFEQGVRFSSYCLEKNFDNMLNLWAELINEIQFIDQTRLKTLIMMAVSSLSAGISDMGHNYAMIQSASSLFPTAQRLETFSGMTQVNKMKELAMSEDLDATIEALNTIGKAVLNKHNLRVAINCGQIAKDDTVNKVEQFLQNIPGNPVSNNIITEQTGFVASSNKAMYELPFSVNFVGKGLPSTTFSHPDFARLTILAKLMSAKFLHREIREKGGAYGSGAICGQGVFNMFSYRDPNSTKTLEVFDAAAKWVMDGKFEDIDIDEAKLTAFKQADMPVTPGDMGMTNFLQGINDDMRQTFRDQLFAVGRDDLIKMASQYLSPSQDVTGISCIGPENSVINQDKTWTVHKA